jgi:hypothetical protein
VRKLKWGWALYGLMVLAVLAFIFVGMVILGSVGSLYP